MNKTPEELRTEFWKEDEKRGSIIRSQYDEIKRVLHNDDMEWVLSRYTDIKRHAIEHTEYYKDYKVDDDFPIVDKTSIISNYEAHKADGGFELPTHVSSTSGSTGTPFSVIQDYKKRMRNIADLKVFGELCDYPSHERMVFFRVLSEKLHRTPEQEDRENIYYIDSSDLGKKHLGEMVDAILEKKPRIVFSYPSTLVEIAKYIQTTDIKPEMFSLKSVLTAGEGISEENRKLLKDTFGCRLYRRYSDMELGILGQDMGDGKAYILNWGSYYFECLKENSDEPTAPGEVGRIVITDLFNKALPMIRYDTGDLGVMELSDSEKFPVLKEIYGRKRDCIYSTDGRLISPAKISVSMWGAVGVAQWQFIQEDEFEYVLKLNGDSSMNCDKITDKIKNVIGVNAQIKVELVNEIPVTASNKRRAVICNYKKD